MSDEPKYPDVTVRLSGGDGNAFSIISRVRRALRRAGYEDAIPLFTEEARSGDYRHVLDICAAYVNVE